MPLYRYKAYTDHGQVVTGQLVAKSPAALDDELAQKGLFLSHARSVTRLASLSIRRNHVSLAQFYLLVQEATALLNAGLSLPEALEILADRPSDDVLGQIMSRVLSEVREGKSFSQACAAHADSFEPLFVSTLKAGETSGTLPKVLEHYRDYLKQKIEINRKVGQAFVYPAFLFLALIIVLSILFLFVLPRFAAMYADLDAALPLPTQVLVNIVDSLPLAAPLLVVLLITAWMMIKQWGNKEEGRRKLDRLKTKTPLFGGFVDDHARSQLARTLATTLAGGLPLIQALKTTSEAQSNREYAARLDMARTAVSEGASLAHAFSVQGLFPTSVIKMIQAGEESGGLAAIMADIATYLEGSLEQSVTRLTSMIEPILMLLMGLLVGGVIIVMYLPIFAVADVIQ